MFYGDNIRWWVGTVKATDPENQGRFKVRIHGLHSDEVEDKYLPYAQALIPTTEPGTSGLGLSPQLQPSAFVFGIFLDGKQSQLPLILGSMPHTQVPSSVQRENSRSSSNFFKDGDRQTSSIYSGKVTPVIVTDDMVALYNNGKANADERRMILMKILTDEGLSPRAAAGVVGNLAIESLYQGIRFNPDAAKVDRVESSYGLAQWNANVGRYQMLVEFTANQETPVPWNDFFGQVKFLVHDMKTNPAHEVWTDLSNDSLVGEINVNVKDFSNPAWLFLKRYEVAIETHWSQRVQQAQIAEKQWYASLAKTRNPGVQ